MKTSNILHAVSAAALLVATSCAPFSVRQGVADRAPRPAAGPPAASPASSVTHATPTSLDGTKGRVVLVGFWATYCDPCKRSLSKYQALQDEFGGELAVVAISVDEPDVGELALLQFARQAHVHLPLLWDTDHALQARFAPRALPTSYILDRSGEVRFVHPHYEAGDEEKMAREISSLVSTSL